MVGALSKRIVKVISAVTIHPSQGCFHTWTSKFITGYPITQLMKVPKAAHAANPLNGYPYRLDQYFCPNGH